LEHVTLLFSTRLNPAAGIIAWRSKQGKADTLSYRLTYGAEEHASNKSGNPVRLISN